MGVSQFFKFYKWYQIAQRITYTISERSFSILKRAKRSKLSTTTDNRLNHLLMTHIYNEEFKKIKINNYKRVYRSEGE